MAELTGGELVTRVLVEEGVRHIFTLCGGHILPIYDACLKDGIAVVDTRHEQAAAHAADAYARLTRGLGVAVVVPGPGVTDAVTGVANALAARSPMLLIGGASPLALKGMGALQEMEQVALFRPITKGAWAVPETRLIPEYLVAAIQTARSGRPGPVFVEIPVDLLMGTVEASQAAFPARGSVARPRPPEDEVARVAALLAEAERPALVAGSGVYWAGAVFRAPIRSPSSSPAVSPCGRPTPCSFSARRWTSGSVTDGRPPSARRRDWSWWTPSPASSGRTARWTSGSPRTSG
jgi:acetolactate synthase-1/2/3 large subunit